MFRVTPIGPNETLVVWHSMYRSKPGQKDDDSLTLVSSLFRARLDNLKNLAEAR